jgi:hypothetical protein
MWAVRCGWNLSRCDKPARVQRAVRVAGYVVKLASVPTHRSARCDLSQRDKFHLAISTGFAQEVGKRR